MDYNTQDFEKLQAIFGDGPIPFDVSTEDSATDSDHMSSQALYKLNLDTDEERYHVCHGDPYPCT